LANSPYTLLAGALRRTVPPSLRVGLRRQLTRFDSPELRHARRLVKRLRSNPPGVIYLGDSTTLFVDPRDADQRRLGHMEFLQIRRTPVFLKNVPSVYVPLPG
jgi:hypothetical protein